MSFHPARLAYVAGQIAPSLPVVKADWTPSGTTAELSCGHTKQIVSHFHVKVGETLRCYHCGEARARALPEFRT